MRQVIAMGSPRGRAIGVSVLLILGTAWFENWFLDLHWSNWTHSVSRGDLVDAYVTGLAHGRSFIQPEEAGALTNANFHGDPQFRISDASYFAGKYYIYYGLAPFVTVLVPWFKLTGTYLNAEFCIWIALLIGYGAYAGALLAIQRGLGIDIRVSAVTAGVVSLIVGSGTAPLLDAAAINDLESASGYCCSGLTVFFLALAVFSRKPAGYLVAGALCAALVMACRPNCLPAVAVAFVIVLAIALRRGPSSAARATYVLCATLPMLAGAIGLLSWNYLRFGNVLEFGVRYGTGVRQEGAPALFATANLAYNVYNYCFGGFWVGRYFPFIESFREGLISRPVLTHETFDHVYGCFFISPVLFLAAFTSRGSGRIGFLALFSAFGNLIFLSLLGFGAYRYKADFLGLLSFGAALGSIGVVRLSKGMGAIFLKILLVMALGFSTAAALCETFAIAEERNGFAQHRPRDFQAWAGAFDHIIYIGEKIFRTSPRAPRLMVNFPGNKFGAVEPLLVTGEPGQQDFVYAYYTAPGLLQLGFEAMGRGGPLSCPIAIDYQQPHQLDIFTGSFLPPADHPMLKNISREAVRHLQQTLRIALDGKIVLEDFIQPHPTRAQVFCGTSPDDNAFGSQFTGQMGLGKGMSIAALSIDLTERRENYGPVDCKFKLSTPIPGTFQPLVSLGNKPTGGLLAIEVISQTQARFLWLPSSGPRLASDVVMWDYATSSILRFSIGSFFPEIDSKIWNPSLSLAQRHELKDSLTLTTDTKSLLAARVKSAETFPEMVRLGQNSVSIGGVPAKLDGTITITRLPW